MTCALLTLLWIPSDIVIAQDEIIVSNTSEHSVRFRVNGVSRVKGEFDEVTGIYSSVSDRRLKKNINPLPDALHKLMKLKPCQYHFLENEESEPQHYGLIAQEVVEIFPEIVDYSSESDKHLLSYSELVPVLIKAIQEQQAMHDQLVKQIAHLEADLERLKR